MCMCVCMLPVASKLQHLPKICESVYTFYIELTFNSWVHSHAEKFQLYGFKRTKRKKIPKISNAGFLTYGIPFSKSIPWEKKSQGFLFLCPIDIQQKDYWTKTFDKSRKFSLVLAFLWQILFVLARYEDALVAIIILFFFIYRQVKDA